jgi:hypothetical protein
MNNAKPGDPVDFFVHPNRHHGIGRIAARPPQC